jgi:V/A-type H+-transporting ATPase subunit I
VLLRAGGSEAVAELRSALEGALGAAVDLREQPLASGETALLVLVPAASASRLEELLAQARVDEVKLPAEYGEGFLAALPRLRARRGGVALELEEVERELAAAASDAAGDLLSARSLLHDGLSALTVLPMLGATDHALVVEGWVPAGGMERLRRTLARRLGDRVSVERLGREAWHGEEAPVELRNPRLFRPFEALVRPLPLPRYGSLDPTPFVAIFFPMFFGVILGDLGYGALLALGALLLGRGAAEETLRHSAARIAGACASFALVFGLLYGELFGDLGRRLGMRPLLFDREEAVVPFLVLALGLGFAHLLVGLVAGALAALRGERRHALGRGLAALMLVLVAVALLAGLDVLPGRLFHPAVIGLLVAFPAIVLVEGIVAPVELLSTLGHVLSYARIMAIGTASVMLAVVANRMVGMFGSVVVGSLFAFLFHLVNFALGVFSPAVHALRLHYVEFFGTCYSAGGLRYQPLARWHAAGG